MTAVTELFVTRTFDPFEHSSRPASSEPSAAHQEGANELLQRASMWVDLDEVR
jgi:hypothetical protein